MDKQKYYVATAIPYVNDVPHIGNALDAIIADVLARYQKAQGKEVFFSYGTDEHGGKIMDKANSLGISPQRYVDQMTNTFKDLTQTLHVEYTKFIRTTDKDHETRVAAIWEKLKDDIYPGKYSGMYDQKEEEFLTHEQAREIEKTDQVRFARLQPIEEENYFFKLSKYTEPIKEAIESGALRVEPKVRRNEIMGLLKEGLQDISVSRPKEKIPWGIGVPGDDNQTIYVWVEALLNYITTLGYPEGEDFKKFWPCDTHVIGKDIVRFHAAIWPAILLSLGLELPKQIYVHGFITSGGQKMSKSVGNVVAPIDIISGYGADPLRYYFLRHIPSNEDGDFSWEKFEHAYNGELGNELGNLVQRVASMVNRYQEGVIGAIPGPRHDVGPYDDALADFRFDRALDYVWSLIRGMNQYIDEQKPWELAKAGDDEHLREVLAYAVSGLLQHAELLEPFLPQTGQAIKAIFGEGIVKNHDGPLFPRINNYTPA